MDSPLLRNKGEVQNVHPRLRFITPNKKKVDIYCTVIRLGTFNNFRDLPKLIILAIISGKYLFYFLSDSQSIKKLKDHKRVFSLN